MRHIKTVLLVILAAAALIFTLQNAATVEIQFLVWSFAAPRALVFALLVAIGFVLGLLAPGVKALRHRH